MTPEEAAVVIQKHLRGYRVRRQARVRSESPGIIRTTIRGGENLGLSPSGPRTPAEEIQSRLQPGAVYNRLTVVGGAQQGGVFGTGRGEAPRTPAALAEAAPSTTAVINGGYFVHKGGLQTDTGEAIHGLGRPVGPTATRDDHTPVPEPWRGDYGALTVGGGVGLSSGPLLAHGGATVPLPDDARFKYRLGSDENPLNSRAGALTHASDANERAALSLTARGNHAVMHTLTANGARNLGATMAQWQEITRHGASSAQGAGEQATLNLDGGGSVFMGIRTPSGVRMVSRGGPSNQEVRPVANIVASRPQLARR